MLTTAEVASMQATQAETLTTPCTIARRVYTDDGMGGQEETLSLAETVCRIAPSANMPDYQIYAARAAEKQLWRVTFAAGTDVRMNDQVIVQGRTLEVLGVLAPATVETARRTICVEG